MPRLHDADLLKKQSAIEKAALRLFIRQGFYGTSIRDIARAAGISIGNIYNYYPTKEALYLSLVKRQTAEMMKIQERLKPLLGRFDADSLSQLAQATRDIVYGNADYWRLMYVDVTEFGNRHFAHIFRRLSKILEQRSGGYQAAGLRSEVDPSLAYTAIYLQFFTYFLVEKLFGGKHHLGLPETDALDQLIRIFRGGIVAPAEAASALQEQSHEGSDALDGLLCPGSAAGTSGADTHYRSADRDR